MSCATPTWSAWAFRASVRRPRAPGARGSSPRAAPPPRRLRRGSRRCRARGGRSVGPLARDVPRAAPRVAVRGAGVRHRRHGGVRAGRHDTLPAHGHLAPGVVHRVGHGPQRAGCVPVAPRDVHDDPVGAGLAVPRGARRRRRAVVARGRRPRGRPRGARAAGIHPRDAPALGRRVHAEAHGDGADHDAAGARVGRARRVGPPRGVGGHAEAQPGRTRRPRKRRRERPRI